MTRAAPDLMSLLSTGAPESIGTPWVMTWCPSIWASAPSRASLLHRAEAGLEEVLGHHGRAVRDGVVGQGEGLQVGREARVGQRRDVEGTRAPVDRGDPEAARRDLDVAARLLEGPERGPQVLGDPADDLDVPARRGGGEGPRAGRDAVGDDGVLGGGEGLDPVDGDAGRAGALEPGAHRDEHLGDVDDFGLLGDVVDRRRATGQDRRREDVLGGPHAGEVEPDVGTVQAARCRGHEVAVGHVHLGAEGLEAGRVQVEAARADRVAARHGHVGLPHAGHERTEH